MHNNDLKACWKDYNCWFWFYSKSNHSTFVCPKVTYNDKSSAVKQFTKHIAHLLLAARTGALGPFGPLVSIFYQFAVK